jgi:hypothetical protein
MTNYGRLLITLLSGRSDANLDFDDMRRLLYRLGFVERVRGSHHIFVKAGIRDMINLQRDGRLAKPYQVRQVRAIITANGLTVEEEEE